MSEENNNVCQQVEQIQGKARIFVVRFSIYQIRAYNSLQPDRLRWRYGGWISFAVRLLILLLPGAIALQSMLVPSLVTSCPGEQVPLTRVVDQETFHQWKPSNVL